MSLRISSVLCSRKACMKSAASVARLDLVVVSIGPLPAICTRSPPLETRRAPGLEARAALHWRRSVCRGSGPLLGSGPLGRARSQLDPIGADLGHKRLFVL